MKNMFKKFLIGTLAVVAFVVTANLALASYDFGSTILKVGSRGQYVTTLQNLVGATPVDGVFGLKTKAKVVAWQAAHGLTADGLFGNLSKAKTNETGTNFGVGCTNASGFSITTGFACSSLNANTFPAGCTNASGFSITTGFACSSLNAHTFPAGCTNASGFSTITGFSCLTGLAPTTLPIVRGGGSSGSSHHDTALTAIGAIIGTLQVGQELTAGAVTPSGATVSYQWQIGDIAGGVSYPDIEGATSSTYTILTGDVGKYLDVTATGTGSYSGSVKSAATIVITPSIITSATATSSSPAIGGAGINATVAGGANYTHTSTDWSGSSGDTYVTGETPIAVITLAPKTGYTFVGLLAADITVTGGTVTYVGGQGVLGGGTSVVFTVTYPQLTTVGVGTAAATGGTHTIVYTLTTGTFAAAAETTGNWTLGGANAADLGNVSGIVRSVNNTIATVTVSGTIGAVGQVYTIAPATVAFATGYTAPAAATVTVAPAVPVIATVSTIVSGKINPSDIVITLTGDTFTGEGISDQVANWTITYGDTGLTFVNGTPMPIVRNSATQLTFNFTGMAAPGTITLKANAAALTGGVESNEISIIIPVAGFAHAVSAAYTTSDATTIIHITLAEGSFRLNGGDPIDKNDFNFAGTDAIAIATYGSFARTSDTIVTITGLGTYLAGGNDNTVDVLGATQASQVTTVTATIE